MTARTADLLRTIGLCVLVIAIFIIVFCTAGCRSTCPPCQEPEQVIVKVNVPVPCIVDIAPLPAVGPLVRTPYPVGADEETLKAWALTLGEAIEARLEIMDAREAAWLAKVTANNSALPKCSAVAPP